MPTGADAFPLGLVVVTTGVKRELPDTTVAEALARHRRGDWGECCPNDAVANDVALKNGRRLLSVYIGDGVKFWVITEGDRSSTTVLLPEEY